MNAKRDSKKFEISLAINQLPIHSTEKLLMKLLVDYFNPQLEDNVFPTVRTLSSHISKSDVHTRRLINGLAKKGWLVVIDAKRLVGEHLCFTSNRYRFPPSILLHQEFLDSENVFKKAKNLKSSDAQVYEAARARMEAARLRLDAAKFEVINLEPRESQLNGLRGAADRYGKSLDLKENVRECKIVDFEKIPPACSSDGGDLTCKLEGIKHEGKTPSNTSIRLNNNLNSNLNNNSKSPTKTSPMIDPLIKVEGDLVIKKCLDLYSEKLAKPRPSSSSAAEFKGEFLARGFTFEGFEKNLELVANDELLKRTTFSITRILEIDTAIKAKELFKTRMLKELQRSVGNMSRFDDFIFAEAKNWGFKTHEELFEWLGFKTESSAPKQASQQFTEIAKPISKDVEIKAQAVENEPFQGEPLIVTESKILVDEILDICQDFEPVELSPELRNLLHNPPQRDTAPPFLDESVEELVDELRELLVAPNFRPYLGSSEIIDYLVQKLSKARYFSDLFALILHPIFRQTASKSVARNIKAA